MKKRSNKVALSGSSPLACSPFRETVTWYKASERSPEDGEEVLVQLAENGVFEENLFRNGVFHWLHFSGRWSRHEAGVVGWWSRPKGPYFYAENVQVGSGLQALEPHALFGLVIVAREQHLEAIQ